MKILQINKYFYRKGGAETVFFNTIKLLEEQGHTVIPFSLQHKKNEPSKYAHYFVNYPELSDSSPINRLIHTPSFFYNREAARKLEHLIRLEKPDIAHIHLMFNSLSVSILPVLRKYNIPTVMSVHDYRLVCPAYTFTDGNGNFCERCKDKRYYHCIANRCSKKNLINSVMLCMDSYLRSLFFPPIQYISKFIFVSKFSMNKHIQVEPAFREKTTYLYNFTPPVEEKKKIKGNYLFFFGRISEEKGILTLLQAISKLPHAKLKLAGTGPLFDNLKAQCPPNAEFLGFKHGKELQSLIHGASFVIVPSECYENNPMTIIESYTIGTPTIGSDLGGIPELINEGDTGFTFKPKSIESLQSVISKALEISEERYEKMVENCRQFAKANFSESEHYKKLMCIYQSIIEKKKN
ncbi:glycosyltransferase family 4 protein [Parabacteroides distasonis]|uniref:glycosyltransferase family 4 protein n=1 Tax=Parabacteroides distasonis TaxID=823 RepID=UPI0039B5E769